MSDFPTHVMAHVVLDTANDALQFRVVTAEGDVTVLALDLNALSVEDLQKLRNVRDVNQVQRAAGIVVATKGPA